MTHWDDQGRPSEWVTITEPEWTEDDRAMIAALLDYEADCCPSGHWLPESVLDKSKEATVRFQGGFSICRACYALEKAQLAQSKRDEPIEKAHGHVFHGARMWFTTGIPIEPEQPPDPP